MMHTIESAKRESAEHSEEIWRNLADYRGMPEVLKSVPLIRNLWAAGSWLNATLVKLGADDGVREKIGFVHGQRSFGNDSWQVAVNYANEYESTHNVVDLPGLELATIIHREMTMKNQEYCCSCKKMVDLIERRSLDMVEWLCAECRAVIDTNFLDEDLTDARP